jgi:hypothetical protein
LSGWLLDVLATNASRRHGAPGGDDPRGQVEWFGSGDCEPVLAAIPHRDRLSRQIATLSDKIERRFGMRPTGAWLTERVWESSVVTSLVATGIRYVAVDDYHFLCAGESQHRPPRQLFLHRRGRPPTRPVPDLRSGALPPALLARRRDGGLAGGHLARQGRRAAIYFDDIEKFGIWPDTYDWVYEKGWLTQFVEGVLASPLIRTETYRRVPRPRTHARHRLPADHVLHRNERMDAAGSRAPRVPRPGRGGKGVRPFRGAQALPARRHLAQLHVALPRSQLDAQAHARRVAAPGGAAPAQRTPALQEWLHRAQANDAYWHGLFGGLYLPHLRRAIWNNLLKLEAALERLAPWPRQQQGDLDHDGHVETALRKQLLHAYVRDDGNAALVELSSLPLAHNFGDTLRAYAEAYHDKIRSLTPPGQHSGEPASPRRTTAWPTCTPSCPATPTPTSGRAASSSIPRSMPTTCCGRSTPTVPGAEHRPLGGRRRRLAHREALRAEGDDALSRHLPHRGRTTPASFDRNRDQPRDAQLRRLRRPLRTGRRQRAGRLRRSAAGRVKLADAGRQRAARRAAHRGQPAGPVEATPIAPFRNPKPASKRSCRPSASRCLVAGRPASSALHAACDYPLHRRIQRPRTLPTSNTMPGTRYQLEVNPEIPPAPGAPRRTRQQPLVQLGSPHPLAVRPASPPVCGAPCTTARRPS